MHACRMREERRQAAGELKDRKCSDDVSSLLIDIPDDDVMEEVRQACGGSDHSV